MIAGLIKEVVKLDKASHAYQFVRFVQLLF